VDEGILVLIDRKPWVVRYGMDGVEGAGVLGGDDLGVIESAKVGEGGRGGVYGKVRSDKERRLERSDSWCYV